MPKRKVKELVSKTKKPKLSKQKTRFNQRRLVELAIKEKDLLANVPHLKSFKSASTGELFEITCTSYRSCSEEQFNWMMNLLEKNMSVLYDSCGWGWNYNVKKEEMSGEDSRFIIAMKADNKQLVAFSHFKFDMDNGYNVVYCYELQVDECARTMGLGKHIMCLLDALCSFFNMAKVVLTVFNENERAYKFFCSQGFTLDESSPQCYSAQSCYSILSKTAIA